MRLRTLSNKYLKHFAKAFLSGLVVPGSGNEVGEWKAQPLIYTGSTVLVFFKFGIYNHINIYPVIVFIQKA